MHGPCSDCVVKHRSSRLECVEFDGKLTRSADSSVQLDESLRKLSLNSSCLVQFLRSCHLKLVKFVDRLLVRSLGLLVPASGFVVLSLSAIDLVDGVFDVCIGLSNLLLEVDS